MQEQVLIKKNLYTKPKHNLTLSSRGKEYKYLSSHFFHEVTKIMMSCQIVYLMFVSESSKPH